MKQTAMEKTLDEFNRAKGKVVNDFKAIVSDAEALLQATAHVPGESFATERAKFSERLQHAKTQLVEAEQRVVEKARQAATATDHYVHESPWTAVGIAAAAGILIGFLTAKR